MLRSKLKVESEASVISSVILEGKGKAVGSRRSETGDEILVFELNSITIIVSLLEIDSFRVEEDSVEFDIDINSGELGIVSGSSKLNKSSITTSISLLAFLTGWAARLNFSIVQAPLPQIVKGQGIAWSSVVSLFLKMVKAEMEQTSAMKTKSDLFMFSTLIILLRNIINTAYLKLEKMSNNLHI